MVFIYVNNQGKVATVKYVTPNDSGITLEEFDQLTTHIKKDITMIVPNGIPSGKFGRPINYPIKFNLLLKEMGAVE